MGSQEGDGQLDADALMRVLDVTRRLATPFELNELLGQIIDAGRQVFHADRGSVFLYDEPAKELFTVVATGVKEIRFSIERGIAGQCARDRTIINVPDCYADARFNPQIDRQTGYRTRCLIAVPLVGLDEELVGVMQLLNPSKGRFDARDEQIADALASQAAAAIQRVRLLDERMVKMKLENDLNVARRIQMDVLPTTLPSCPGYELAGLSRPADQTGGDIYDVTDVTGVGVILLLADATGHGIGAALSVTQVRAMLRLGLRLSRDLDVLFEHINRQLSADLASNRFVTALLGVLDPTSHTIRYHAAGQGPMLHYHVREDRCQWQGATTLPWGILEELTPEPPTIATMEPGDVFAILTDGFYEYHDPDNEQMGTQRVGQIVAAHHHESAQQILERLFDAVGQFARGAPQMDDLTAVVVKRVEG